MYIYMCVCVYVLMYVCIYVCIVCTYVLKMKAATTGNVPRSRLR